LYTKISNADYKVPPEVYVVLSQEAIDLLALLFLTNADKRPTAKEVLNHAWLANVPLPRDLRQTQP
jgi:hypothetical protein